MKRTRLLRPALLLTVAAALLHASVADARPTTADERIVGGTLATQEWPAQGYLRLTTSSGTYLCGGTLVSGRWFLTAAHCVTNDDDSVLAPGAFRITLGRSDLSVDPPAERYTVGTVLRHESYDPDTTNVDVALLRISSATAPPQEPLGIVTASETALWAPGTTATIIGWGTTSAGGTTSDQLREAKVPIVGDTACGSAYGPWFVPAAMVCAGNGVADTCQGDSGGPLMVPRQGDFVLAGITSWGNGCADPQYPGVYTRVGASALNAWVRSRIPTASIDVSPSAPQAGDTVQLVATATKPAGQAGDPTSTWDLDDDGAYDDATGATATLPPASSAVAGTYVVRAQQAYPDGDRAVAREAVTVAAAPPAPPPPPPPPLAVVTPPPPPPPAPLVTPPAPRAALPALARLVSVPTRVRVSSLLDRRTSVRVMCSTACSIEASLQLDGPTARKAGLMRSNSSVRIGSGSARFMGAKTARVTIELTRSAVRRLRTVGKGGLLLRVTVTAGSRSARLNQVQQLRR